MNNNVVLSYRGNNYRRVYQRFGQADVSGRDVYVKEDYLPLFLMARSNQSRNFYFASIMRATAYLNSYHDYELISKKTKNITATLPQDSFDLTYEFHPAGHVLITLFTVNSRLEVNKNNTNSGYYGVKYTKAGRQWEVDNIKAEESISKSSWPSEQVSKPAAHYLGMGGKFDNTRIAGKIVGGLILKAFGDLQKILHTPGLKTGDTFVLSHTSPRTFKDSDNVQRVVSGFEQAALQKKPLNVLVHGEAAQTLLLVAEQLRNRSAARKLEAPIAYKELINLIVVNPVGVTEKKVTMACEKAGIPIAATYTNNRHLNNYLLPEKWKEMFDDHFVKIGAAFLLGMTAGNASNLATQVTASSRVSGSANLVKAIPSMLGTPAGILLTTIASGFAGYGAYLGYKEWNTWKDAIKAVGLTTYHGGNNYIFTDDKDLFQQMGR